jgi:hypothetical protein
MDTCPPNVLSVLMSGAALQLVLEEAIGVTVEHADTLAFVEGLLQKTERGRSPKKVAGSRRRS